MLEHGGMVYILHGLLLLSMGSGSGCIKDQHFLDQVLEDLTGIILVSGIPDDPYRR